LRRVETLVLMGDVDLPLPAVRQQVVAAIDVVVHLARSSDGRRRVVAVGEVDPDCEATAPLRVRALAREAKVIALPERAVRSAAAGPACTQWIDR
jgi:Flp pilus assembly CpaF family ATPase